MRQRKRKTNEKKRGEEKRKTHTYTHIHVESLPSQKTTQIDSENSLSLSLSLSLSRGKSCCFSSFSLSLLDRTNSITNFCPFRSPFVCLLACRIRASSSFKLSHTHHLSRCSSILLKNRWTLFSHCPRRTTFDRIKEARVVIACRLVPLLSLLLQWYFWLIAGTAVFVVFPFLLSFLQSHLAPAHFTEHVD